MAMLLKYKPYWAINLATISAANSNCLKIVSSKSFQHLVDEAWSDGVKTSFIKVLLSCLCPLVILWPSYPIDDSLETKLDNIVYKIPREAKPEDEQEDIMMNEIEIQSTHVNRAIIFFNSPMTKFSYNLVFMTYILHCCLSENLFSKPNQA